MYTSAELSPDRLMRWELERIWNLEVHTPNLRICVFVMLNPSKADGLVDDPTIGKVITFAKYWGYDGIRVVNLVGYRATDPRVMYEWFKIQNLLDLNEHLTRAVRGATKPDVAKVVLAYGKIRPCLREHAYSIVRAIAKVRNTYDIKLNKDGTPAHPLYLKGTLTPNLHFGHHPASGASPRDSRHAFLD